MKLLEVILLAIAAGGFYHAVQAIRGEHLNIKPFNCRLCLSFWFTVVFVLLFNLSVYNLYVMPFAVVGLSIIIGFIEGRITHYQEII